MGRATLATSAIASIVLVSAIFGCDLRADRPPEPNVVPTKSPHAEPSVEAAVVDALSLMEHERYTDAIKTLEVFGSDSEPRISKIREEARSEAEAMLRFRTACLETDGRDLDAVYERCRRVGEKSRYYNQGCCAGAAERCGKARLAEAVERLRDEDPAEGLSLLQLLIDDEHIPSTLRERARALKERSAQRRGERTGVKRSSTDKTTNGSLSPWLDDERPSKERPRPTTLESWLD